MVPKEKTARDRQSSDQRRKKANKQLPHRVTPRKTRPATRTTHNHVAHSEATALRKSLNAGNTDSRWASSCRHNLTPAVLLTKQKRTRSSHVAPDEVAPVARFVPTYVLSRAQTENAAKPVHRGNKQFRTTPCGKNHEQQPFPVTSLNRTVILMEG